MTETTTTTARGKGRSERATAGKADGFDAASFAGKGRETFESLLRTGAEAMSGNYDTLLAFNKEARQPTILPAIPVQPSAAMRPPASQALIVFRPAALTPSGS